LENRIAYFTSILIENAGQNPVQDASYSGLIKGYRDILYATSEDFFPDMEDK
jgi:hypothetical protein